MAIKKKYTESHWLVFGLQGLVALIFGWYIMFTDITDISALIIIVGYTLLGLGIIEILNAVMRRHRQHAWGLSLSIAIIEIAVAISLLLIHNLSIPVLLSIVAGYTILRGIFEVLIGTRSLSDPTDKFLWIITGMFGMVLGFVILNSGNLDIANVTFVKIFGTYMMVFGLTNLIFAVHVKNEYATTKTTKATKAKKAKK